MEDRVSEILENVLGLLGLEGSFEVNETAEQVEVSIDTPDAGRLIGARGETIDALNLIVNQIVNHQVGSSEFKRVVVDVGGWRQNKEADLERRAKEWVKQVKETGKEMELEPMPSWQRRIVHMVAGEDAEVSSESVGEGKDRHLVIKPTDRDSKAKDGVKSPEPLEEATEEPPANEEAVKADEETAG